MMADDSKALEDLEKLAEEIKKNIKPINAKDAEKTIKEIEGITKSIDTDAPSKSTEEHELYIKGLNLSYDDLLRHAAKSGARCERIELENKYLNLRLEAYEKIDSVKQDLHSQHDNATDAVIELMRIAKLASNTRASLEGQIKGRDAGVAARKNELSKLAIAGKKKKNPKQKDRALVKEHWDAWQQNRGRYKGAAAFARDMVEKHENLISVSTIERWCGRWKK